MHRAHRLSTAVCLVLTLATACASDSKKRNVPPFVEAVEADASIVDPGSETTVRVTAGDPDGGGSPASGLSSSLTATWSVRGEGWSIEGSGAEATVTAPDSYRSTATVSVEVGDDGGASASGSVDLTTGSNELPRLVSLTADPNPVEPAGRVDLKADASDPRGDELSYSWSAPEGWSLGSTSGQSVDLTAPDSSEATGRVELTVSDGFEGTIRRSIRVRTTRNSRPQIASMTATPPQVAPAGTARITVDAADPDGDDLGYSWSAPSGWKVTGSGDSVKVDAPDAYGKRAEIRVEVSDPRGNTVTGRVGLSTQSNNGPIVHSLAASPPQVDRGGTSKLQVSASDPNGDTLSYSWSVSGGSGWSIKESGDRATLTAPKAPGRRVRVAVEVADPAGTVARASTVVSTVPNQPPQLVGVSASPPSIQPSGTATVTADATDPDGDSLSYSWTVPAKWSKKGSGKSIDVTAPGSYGAQATVRLEVTDSQGGRAVGAASLVTRANRAPVIASVTASPSTIDKGGKSTLEATASDPNGNSLTYNWTLPSGWKQTGGSGVTIEVKGPDAFGKQGRFVVEVADGNGATARGAVVVQTQRNRPPVISDLSAGKTQLVPGKTTTVTVTAVDPDGDPLTYSWKVPKGWSGSSSSASIDITAPQTFGTSATLKAVVGDGSGTSTETIQLQTINTRPPTINSLSVSPNPVLQNGVAQATVSATDPDGDSLSYKWSFNKNGWSVNGSGNTVDVMVPNAAGKQAKLTVTAMDGRGGTQTKSTTVKTKACSKKNTGNCDRKIGNGCETDLNTDATNCGACGNKCTAPKKHCSTGTCTKLFTFSGVRNNFPESKLGGWSRCYRDQYGNHHDLSDIRNRCDQNKLLLACKKRGSSTIRTAAHAPRSDVLKDTGQGDRTHRANGVEWYYHRSESWGFAPKGANVDRHSCDTHSRGSDKRLCWHTSNGDLDGGWRCGAKTGLNGANNWIRLIYESN